MSSKVPVEYSPRPRDWLVLAIALPFRLPRFMALLVWLAWGMWRAKKQVGRAEEEFSFNRTAIEVGAP